MGNATGGRKGLSLAARFIAAIALTIGFYALALAIALSLIGLPIYGWVEAGKGNIWLTIFALVTGVSILAALVPRALEFEPPGPWIEPRDEPRLMAAVEEMARSTGQPMPDETYVTLQVNAAVTEVPNGLLRPRRRVLIVGLPLLHLLTERGLSGVLAHEFGHYAGGDTRLGPWIWRTRETILRTIDRLTDDDDGLFDRAIRAPFIWYGKAFMRITNALSRRAEFAADAVAASRVGRDAYVTALRDIHALAPAFDLYWEDEIEPAISAGYRPPVLAGFSRFVSTERIRSAAAAHLELELAEARTDPYDSHPSLAERIAALDALAPGSSDHSGPAHALLESDELLEQRTFAGWRVEGEPLAPLSWEDAAERVWLARHRDVVAAHRDLLDDITVATIGGVAVDPAPIADALRTRQPAMTPEEAAGFARLLLAAGIADALARSGWRVEALPGDPFSLVRDSQRIVPSDIVAALVSGETTPEAWRERVAALGIADVRLGEADAEPTGVA
jgi:heat shock protein HtpX